MDNEDTGDWVTLDRRKSKKQKQPPQNAFNNVEDINGKSKNKKKSSGTRPEITQRLTPSGSDKDASSSTRSSSTSSSSRVATSSSQSNTAKQAQGPPRKSSAGGGQSAQDKISNHGKPPYSHRRDSGPKSQGSFSSNAPSKVTNKAVVTPLGAGSQTQAQTGPKPSGPLSYSAIANAKVGPTPLPANPTTSALSYSAVARTSGTISDAAPRPPPNAWAKAPITVASTDKPAAVLEVGAKTEAQSSPAEPQALAPSSLIKRTTAWGKTEATKEPADSPKGAEVTPPPETQPKSALSNTSVTQPPSDPPSGTAQAPKPMSWSAIAMSNNDSSKQPSPGPNTSSERAPKPVIESAVPKPVIEPAVPKPVIEPAVKEAINEPAVKEAVNEPAIKVIVEPDVKAVVEPAVKVVAEPAAKTVAEPPSEKSVEKSVEPKTNSQVPPTEANQTAGQGAQQVSKELAAEPNNNLEKATALVDDQKQEIVVDVSKQTAEVKETRVDLNKNEVDKSLDEVIDLNDSSSSSKSGSQIKLKYNYKDDQWSPINVEGKRQYDRQFLLQLQTDPLSLEKPQNLPKMEIIKDKSTSVVLPTKDWTPGFIKGVIPRASITKKASQGKRSNGQPTKTIDLKITEVELHKSENAWKPGKIDVVNGEGDPDEIQVLLRKVRGILNKLCPQKFDTLVAKFNELDIDTEEKLRNCIELIFEKAVDEPGFSVAYARMCEVIQKKQVTVDVTPDMIGKGQPPQPVNLRKILITKCQKEFERDYMEGLDKVKYEADLAAAADDEAKKAELLMDWEEKERRARRKSLGNIQFIGELYKLKMLTGRIMHECIKKLIIARDEESLESMCKLLTTVGKDLEAETNDHMGKMSPNELKKMGLAPFDHYFKQIEALSEDKTFPSRVRFMLQDVIELRKSNWKPRREAAGPKTIEQIHKEAQREKTQQQLLDDLMTPRGREREMSGGSGYSRGNNDARKKSSRSGQGAGQLQTQVSEDGWMNVQPSRAAQRSNVYDKIDTNKIASLAQSSARRMDADTMQLGPGTRSIWGQGSGSQRLTRVTEDSRIDTRNKFSMLNDQSQAYDDKPRNDEYPDQRWGAGGSSKSMIIQGRNSRGPSVDNDRASALEAVRQAMNGPSRDRTNENLVSGPTASVGPQAASRRPVPEDMSQVNDVLEQSTQLRGRPDLNEIEAEKQSKIIIDDYLLTDDIEAGIDTTCKIFHSSTIAVFVETTINKILEKSDKERNKVGFFFKHLIQRKILLSKQFQAGLNSILEFAEDLVVDIPRVWNYFGAIIAPSLTDRVLPMSFLAGHKLAKETDLAGKYLSGVLHAVIQLVGEDATLALWKSSNVRFCDFIPDDAIHQFAKANHIEFLMESVPKSSKVDPLLHDLSKLLQDHAQNDAIMTWIRENVGDKTSDKAFIRTLTTAVIESSLKDGPLSKIDFRPDVLSSRKKLLLHFIDGRLELETQALFAIHHLIDRLEHPSMVLHGIFEKLYDDEVISEEALYEWESSDDPAEMEGKGVAVNATKSFFKWLREAELEQDDNS